MTSAMRLLRLRLDGGPMRGEWSFAPEGATLITAPAAARHAIREAIVFALYGPSDSSRGEERGGIGAGGVGRVILELEAGGERQTITRRFDGSALPSGGGPGPGSLESATLAANSAPTGERLLGLARAEFARWILGGCPPEETGPNPGVLRHMDRLGRAAAAGARGSAAVAVIRQALQDGDRQAAGEREALAEIDGELEALAHLRRAMDEEVMRLRVAERRGRAVQAAIARAQAEQRREEAAALRAALAANEVLRTRLRELEAERRALEPFVRESRPGREQVLQWQAETALLEHEIERLSRRLGIVQGEVESASAELSVPRLRQAGSFAREDQDQLVAATARLRERQRVHADAQRRLEDERRHLAARGFPFPWYETATRQFADLDAEATRELLAAREAIAQADHRIAQLWQALGSSGEGEASPRRRGALLRRLRPVLDRVSLGGPAQGARLRAELAGLEEEQRGVLERVERLGGAHATARGRDFLQQFGTYHDLRREGERFRGLEKHAVAAKADSAGALEALGHLLAQAGVGEPSPEAAEALIQAIRERLALEDETRRAAGEVRRITEEIERHRHEVSRRRQQALRAAGVEGEAADCSFEAILRRVDQAEERRRRYLALVQEEIPSLEASLLAPASLAERTARLEAIARDLGQGGLEASGEPISAAELSTLAEEARGLRDEAESVRLTLARADETYRERVPALRAERAAVADRLGRLEERAAALRLAATTLEEAMAEQPAWIESLRELTEPLVPALLPGFGDVRFDRGLRLSVVDRRHGLRLDAAAPRRPGWNEGLAVSLALLAALGVGRSLAAGGVRWPLLLDEPFAAADDAAFRTGMALLLGPVARERQVILLTGHEARLRWLGAEAPEVLRGVTRLRAESPAVLS